MDLEPIGGVVERRHGLQRLADQAFLVVRRHEDREAGRRVRQSLGAMAAASDRPPSGGGECPKVHRRHAHDELSGQHYPLRVSSETSAATVACPPP